MITGPEPSTLTGKTPLRTDSASFEAEIDFRAYAWKRTGENVGRFADHGRLYIGVPEQLLTVRMS